MDDAPKINLAVIEKISEILPHGNADALELAKILNYVCIVKKGEYKAGQKVVFIFPDSVLPDAPWAEFYKKKSNRVKSIKLRGVWSKGIVESLGNLGLPDNAEGDVTEFLKITKYEVPEPQNLQAKGGLPFGLPITDEINWEKLDSVPYGKVVDVTLKRDGKSWTAYAIKDHDNNWHTGICGRRLEYKLDCPNDYTKFQDCLPKLLEYAQRLGHSLVIRGEICGAGVQSNKNNPHSQREKNVSLFSVYLPDQFSYAYKSHPLYYPNVAKELGMAICEFVEQDVVLTPELINKYAEQLTQINEKPFEGVVIKGKDFSFKVINNDYDSKK